MPFTTLRGLSIQTAGTNLGTWGSGNPGNDLNTGVIAPLDAMLGATSFLNAAAGNVTLALTDVQNAMWSFSGVIAADVTVSPAAGSAAAYLSGLYYFENLTTSGAGGPFTLTLLIGSNMLILPQGYRGILFIDAVNGPRLVAQVSDVNPQPVPVGSVTNFYSSTAPLGWTQVTSAGLSTSAMQIVTDTSGGTTGGSVAFNGVFGITATQSHTLTLNEFPQHTHDIAYDVTITKFTSASPYVKYPLAPTGLANTVTTSSTGGGGGHSHTMNIQVKYTTWMAAEYTG